MSAREKPTTRVYFVNRWDCPDCGEVHETDADFAPEETCDSCGSEVEIAE